MGKRRCPLRLQGLQRSRVVATLLTSDTRSSECRSHKGDPQDRLLSEASNTKRGWTCRPGRWLPAGYLARLRPSCFSSCPSTIQNLRGTHLKLLNSPDTSTGNKRKISNVTPIALYPQKVQATENTSLGKKFSKTNRILLLGTRIEVSASQGLTLILLQLHAVPSVSKVPHSLYPSPQYTKSPGFIFCFLAVLIVWIWQEVLRVSVDFFKGFNGFFSPPTNFLYYVLIN